MKNVIISAFALFVVSACGPGPAAETPAPKSGVIRENMDLSVDPGDDFFSYVNGAWVARTAIPPDRPSYGTFNALRDQAQDDVRVIIEAAATGDFASGSDEQKVGDMYTSYMDMATRNRRGIEPLRPTLQRIDAIGNRDELAAYMGYASKIGQDMPISIEQFEDLKNPEQYAMNVFQGGLGLPDREYYSNSDETSANLRKLYVKHIEKMFALAGLPDGASAATRIMALETRIAGKQMLKEDVRKWAVNYNKVARTDLGDVMPEFNWSGYLEQFGIADIDALVIFMTDYLGELDEIIQETDLDTWKTYLAWVALNTSASRLNEELDRQNFEFYSRAMRGTEKQRALWRRAVTLVNGALGEVVGRVYVARHFPPQAKAHMETLVANLIGAYRQSITGLGWMGDQTKAEALAKLSKLSVKIGYPDKWRDYSALEVDAADLFGNIERAILVEHQREVDRQGGPVDKTEWAMSPQTVNAGYNPAANDITFPAAVLQPPFFDMGAEDAINYGAIGSGIGHEIGHGFDDSGSTFDSDGALRNWWTDEDRAEFEKRTSKLVAQFDAFQPFDDLSVNGEYSLGENIGDLGGISIALLAYRMSLNGEASPIIDGFTGLQRFFIGYGQLWREKYRDKRLRQLIQTDKHAPSMYRANGVVRNVPEFYEAFDVHEDNALYLSPEERVRIW